MHISLAEAAERVMAASSVIVTAHQNPDGDAIGSSLGLCNCLKALGKTCRVVIDDKLPESFGFLPGFDAVEQFAAGNSYHCDLLIVLDCEPDRTGQVYEQVVAADRLNIDHHMTNANSETDVYLDAGAAATAEIIHDFLPYLWKISDGAVGEFSPATALPLYTGMATDTGFFRFSNTTPHTMRAAADMIEAGAAPNVVSEALEQRPLEEVVMMARAVAMVEMYHEGRVAAIFLDNEFMQQVDSIEGLVGRIRVIAGVEIAVVLKEKEPGLCRVSLRSKGRDVTRIAARFGGGGHVRAAGCTIEQPFSAAKAALLQAIDEEFASDGN